VTEGYWRAPELNSTRFFEAEGRRWYRTGDLGRYSPVDGYLYSGRADHQVKLRGYRVELHEIEGAVRRLAGSDVVAVLPWPLTQDGNATGCVAFALNSREPEEVVIERCAEMLPDYMVPTRVFSVADIPFNSNGKVDYPALRSHRLLAEAD
jgi:mycobactin phenyloxazoline synthetase